MRIVIASPLYPPDTAPVAAYVKELASRLSKSHDVTLVVYSHIPEEVPGVRIVAVEKRTPRPIRLVAFLRALSNASRDADVIYAINGASVELPLLIHTLVSRKHVVFGLRDMSAHERSGALERHVQERAQSIIKEFPPERPEILPFSEYPAEAMNAYETEWTNHIHALEAACTYEK